METEAQKPTKCQHHHGKAVRRLREDRGWNRETFAEKIGVSKSSLMRLEDKKELPDEIIEKAAKELGVSVDLIKELEEDKPLALYIQENTFSNNSINSKIADMGIISNNNVNTVTDSSEQISKVFESIRQEYKTLLDAQNEIIKLYKNEITSLTEQLQKANASHT